ncbi:transcriptional regulator [Collibacillus ludicampi]|uniref:Transcriptional regulator n=1 Tax=Collibacillus ludicampi TaxID=2771369 RepID=A0AAV4LFU0_9BACL|nr:DUF1232 domain-containing protein [Collibacillus ludicampi]GIM46519.1 transcriptional regulator [Collibacillus ludicampi]
MTEMKRFGDCIRYLLQKKGMTAEELVEEMNASECVKTNKAALSRIMTGKRIPSEEEVQGIAKILETPILFEVYDSLKQFISSQDGIHALQFYEKMSHLLHADDCSNENHHSPKVDYHLLFQILRGLYQYCLNHDLNKLIEKEFRTKLTQIKAHGRFIEQLQTMYQWLQSTKLTKQAHAWIMATLLYFVTPIDLIPDFFIPYGYVDDAIVAGFVFYKILSKYKPQSDE